jgi:hypothetical protein
MNFDLSKSESRLEFGQIILGHIDKILKLSLLGISQDDVAVRYKSAVISLGDSLTAYFDDDMKKAELKFEEKRGKKIGSVKDYRIYFRELLNLVNRVDYFKNSVYGEDRDELISDDEDSEEGDEDD